MATAQFDASIITNKYPFILGLQEMGMYAQLINGNPCLGPRELITTDIIQIARENKQAIIAELTELGLVAAIDKAETFAMCPPHDRFCDLNDSELEQLYDEYVIAYELAAELFNTGNESPFWAGDMDNLANPEKIIMEDQLPPVPFFWVHVMRLNNPAQKQRSYRFYTMFRDVDGKDSIVIEDKLRNTLQSRKQQRGW